MKPDYELLNEILYSVYSRDEVLELVVAYRDAVDNCTDLEGKLIRARKESRYLQHENEFLTWELGKSGEFEED